MHVRDEEIYLPAEIVEVILIFAIKNNIGDVLSFRLVNKLMCGLSESISLALSNKLFGSISNEINKRHYLGANCHAFFKFSQYEARRYQFFLDVLEKYQLEDSTHNELHEEVLSPVSYEKLLTLRGNVVSSWANYKDKVDLEGLIISEGDVFLPEEFDDYIDGIFNCRQFEVIKELFELMKGEGQINIDRVIDQFYLQAAFFYTTVEFVQLMQIIPVDVNRQVGSAILRLGLQSQYIKKPLLHHAAEFGNLELVKYLIENGADINQQSESGVMLIKAVQDSMTSWMKRDKEITKRISSVLSYIETLIYEQVLHKVSL